MISLFRRDWGIAAPTMYGVESEQDLLNRKKLICDIYFDSSFFMLAIENYILENFKDKIRNTKYGMSNKIITNNNKFNFYFRSNKKRSNRIN